MDARDAIMTRVREAVNRKLGQKPAAPPEPLLVISQVGMLEKVRRFHAALEGLNGKVWEASSQAEAKEIVTKITGEASAVASGHEFLKRCGIPSIAGVRSEFTGVEEFRNVCAEAGVGITSAYCLLADTGTIVMRSTPDEPRLISLLPPVHIAVVPRERLLSNLDEMLSMLPRPNDSAAALVMITGPSRTGDIEQILVRGVHGPGSVHVVLVPGKDEE